MTSILCPRPWHALRRKICHFTDLRDPDLTLRVAVRRPSTSSPVAEAQVNERSGGGPGAGARREEQPRSRRRQREGRGGCGSRRVGRAGTSRPLSARSRRRRLNLLPRTRVAGARGRMLARARARTGAVLELTPRRAKAATSRSRTSRALAPSPARTLKRAAAGPRRRAPRRGTSPAGGAAVTTTSAQRAFTSRASLSIARRVTADVFDYSRRRRHARVGLGEGRVLERRRQARTSAVPRCARTAARSSGWRSASSISRDATAKLSYVFEFYEGRNHAEEIGVPPHGAVSAVAVGSCCARAPPADVCRRSARSLCRVGKVFGTSARRRNGATARTPQQGAAKTACAFPR